MRRLTLTWEPNAGDTGDDLVITVTADDTPPGEWIERDVHPCGGSVEAAAHAASVARWHWPCVVRGGLDAPDDCPPPLGHGLRFDDTDCRLFLVICAAIEALAWPD